MKVYGKGFIAFNLKKIKLPKKIFIYAAGVSNSNSKNVKDYKREITQIKKVVKKKTNKIFVYISSLSVENKKLKNDKYIKNKLKIEKIVKKSCKKYLIVRLPQIVGNNNNKHTLTNSLYNNILKNKKLSIWKGSVRNLIDIDDIKKILKQYFNSKYKPCSTINIFNPYSVDVVYLVRIFEYLLNKRAKFKLINKINKNINFKFIKRETILPLNYYKNIKNKDYIKRVLKKYYL